MALFTSESAIGAKNCPNSHGPRSNSRWHLFVNGDCAVPGGQRHSAVDPVLVEPTPTGLSSIVSGHGQPSWKILKHFLRGGQQRSCHPPGWLAQGFLFGSLHGGGTIAANEEDWRLQNVRMHTHTDACLITNLQCWKEKKFSLVTYIQSLTKSMDPYKGSNFGWNNI